MITDPYVTSIVRDLSIPGGRGSARQTFREFVLASPTDVSRLVTDLGKARHNPPPGVVYVGPAWVLLSDPLRDDWVWECGTRHTVAPHGPLIGHRSQQAAMRSATGHAAECGATLLEVTQ